MILTWDKGYADYTDTANWNPRYDELCQLAQSLTVASARTFSDTELLDTLEQLEELLRFYCAEHNMAELEPVMRKFNDLMTLCRDRKMSGVEVQYLQMIFLRVNGILYRGHGQHQQGANCYDQCVQAAQTCFNLLRSTTHLQEKQIFYIAWSCIECWKEAAEAHDDIMDAPGTLRLLREVIPMLEWVDKWLQDYPGICDQAAEQYAACAGMFYQYGDAAGGNRCYHQSARLFNLLDETYASDFYKARAIWMQCLHGTMAFMISGDASYMMHCEKEAAAFLTQRRAAELRDKTIVESAQALIDLQKSTALQQNGKLAEAIDLAKDAIAQLDVSLSILEDDCKDRQGYYRMVMSRITARIRNMCVGSKETLGVMYYQDDDPVASEVTLKEVLAELTSSDKPCLSGSAAVLIQSEVLQYLALIASQDSNVNQADFYATQSADLAVSVANSSGNTNAWGLAVASCCLTAEIALALKNKPKAAQYAQLGLSACDTLARSVPDHPHLSLRSTLEKFRKKASRRFF